MQSSSKQSANAQLQKRNIGNFCELDCSADKSIEKCYRTEALKLHPDRNSGDAAKFIAMKARYDNIDAGSKGLTCAKYTKLGFQDYKVAIREFMIKNEGKIQNHDFLAFLRSVINNKDVYKQVVRLEPLPENEVVLMLENVAGVQKGKGRQLGGAVVKNAVSYDGPKWGQLENKPSEKSNIKKYVIGGLLLLFLGLGAASSYAATTAPTTNALSTTYGSTIKDYPTLHHPTLMMVPGSELSNSNKATRTAAAKHLAANPFGVFTDEELNDDDHFSHYPTKFSHQLTLPEGFNIPFLKERGGLIPPRQWVQDKLRWIREKNQRQIRENKQDQQQNLRKQKQNRESVKRREAFIQHRKKINPLETDADRDAF